MKKKQYKFGSARATAEKMKAGFESHTLVLPEGVHQFKLKTDKPVKLDIMPFLAGEGNPNCDDGIPYWERTFYTHRGVGANNESVVCLARSFGKRCPVCEAAAKMQRDPNADEETIKGMRPKQRQLFVVYDYAEPDKGYQVWDISYHLFGKLLAKRITDAEDGEWDNFWHPTKGLTLRLGIEEKSMGENNFFEVVTIDFTPRKKQYSEDVVEETPVLDDILRVLSYDELKEKLEAVESSDEDDEKPAKKKSKHKKEEDEDEDDADEDEESDEDEDEDEDGDEEDSEDEDDEEDEDEDEEEEDEDEDEEDDEEDEDEEDEKPAKKKKKVVEEDDDGEEEEDEGDDEDGDDDADEDDDDGDDEDEEDEEDEDEEFEKELPSKKKKKSKK